MTAVGICASTHGFCGDLPMGQRDTKVYARDSLEYERPEKQDQAHALFVHPLHAVLAVPEYWRECIAFSACALVEHWRIQFPPISLLWSLWVVSPRNCSCSNVSSRLLEGLCRQSSSLCKILRRRCLVAVSFKCFWDRIWHLNPTKLVCGLRRHIFSNECYRTCPKHWAVFDECTWRQGAIANCVILVARTARLP